MPVVRRPKEMHLQHIGFFPKDVRRPPEWSGPSHITSVCSVSEHVNSEPPDWIDRWLHNDLGFFNSIEQAQTVVPPRLTQFSVFAYRLLPTEFKRGLSEPFAVPAYPLQPIPPTYTSLGYDVVSRSLGSF